MLISYLFVFSFLKLYT